MRVGALPCARKWLATQVPQCAHTNWVCSRSFVTVQEILWTPTRCQTFGGGAVKCAPIFLIRKCGIDDRWLICRYSHIRTYSAFIINFTCHITLIRRWGQKHILFSTLRTIIIFRPLIKSQVELFCGWPSLVATLLSRPRCILVASISIESYYQFMFCNRLLMSDQVIILADLSQDLNDF